MRLESHVLRWLLVACLATNSGCSIEQTCLAYACVNQTTLHGALQVPSGVTQIDVRLCSEGDCRQWLIAVDGPEGSRPCGYWDDGVTQVCLTSGEDGGLREVEAIWDHGDEPLPTEGKDFSLAISNHADDATLLSEDVRVEYEVAREDNCHQCFGGSATF